MTVSTFTVAETGNDGNVRGTGLIASGYPPAFADAVDNATSTDVRAAESVGSYLYREVLLRWDTSALPDDAIISAATLELWANSISGSSKPLIMEWYTWTPSMGAGNYSLTPGATANAGVEISAFTTGQYNVVTLINPTTVSRTGYTGMRIAVDYASAPGVSETYQATFQTQEGLNPAKLNVTYTLPSGYKNVMLMGVG